MTTLERFNRTVIELIHGLPYEEAVKKEYFDNYQGYIPHPITIGRVMQAILNKLEIVAGTIEFELFYSFDKFLRISWDSGIYFADWQLTKPNGQECTSEDQTQETLERILEILNK